MRMWRLRCPTNPGKARAEHFYACFELLLENGSSQMPLRHLKVVHRSEIQNLTQRVQSSPALLQQRRITQIVHIQPVTIVPVNPLHQTIIQFICKQNSLMHTGQFHLIQWYAQSETSWSPTVLHTLANVNIMHAFQGALGDQLIQQLPRSLFGCKKDPFPSQAIFGSIRSSCEAASPEVESHGVCAPESE